MKIGTLAMAVALSGALAAACGHARKSEPVAGPTVLQSGDERHGELVFMEHCNQCHPGGDAGLGPPLNNVKLPRRAIELKVRNGHPIMPRFPEKVISEGELDDLVEYLVALREKDGGG